MNAKNLFLNSEWNKRSKSTDLTETFDLHEPKPLFHTLSDVLVKVSQNPSI